jgi:hypothetical protein
VCVGVSTPWKYLDSGSSVTNWKLCSLGDTELAVGTRVCMVRSGHPLAAVLQVACNILTDGEINASLFDVVVILSYLK